MQYTIESRQLTNEYTHRPSVEAEPRRMVVEAAGPDEAISRYVDQSEAELVSLTNPRSSDESIATIKKDDCVFLVRVYAA